MKNKKNDINIFSKEGLEDAVTIWNRSSITILDIRHELISCEEEIRNYQIPSGMFLYTSCEKAEITLNDTPYSTKRFGLFHGGKGSILSVRPNCEWLEYYMILYKDREVPFYKRELSRLMDRTNPFRQQYGFTPDNPVFFAEQLKKMYEVWKEPMPLDLLYVKTAFYQLIYEIYKELCKGEIHVIQPDVAALAKQYIKEHCRETISIEALSLSLHVSTSYLRSVFKQKTRKSPQEYLIYCRIEEAKKYLSNTHYSIKEIGTSLGFYDEYHFSSAFKKSTSLTPNAYKAIYREKESDYYIGNVLPLSYNKESLVSQDKLNKKGEYIMIKQYKNIKIAAVALSMVLMLSACGTTQTTTKETQTQSTQETTTQETESTRVIETTKGDIEVPANPQRVIATYGMGDILALGVTPIATYDASGTAYEEAVEGIPVWEKFESEDIMEYNPDLILVVNDEQYEAVSKIAPTVLIPFTELSMTERITFLGQILSKEEEAQKVLTEFEEKINDAKEELTAKGIMDKTFSIMETDNNGGVWIYGDKWGRGGDLIYSHLGLKAPQVIQDEIIGKDQYRDVSLETIQDYAGDYIVFSGEMGDLADNLVWQSVPAVEAGHIIPIDFTLFYDIDIYSSNVQLDYFMEKLNEITQ